MRDALVPERPGARVEVRRLAGARPGDELPDAAVALVAPGSDVSAVRAYARAGVPGGRGRGGGARGAGARPRGGTGRARRCRGRLQRGRPARQARGMARLGVREGPRARRPTSPSAAGAVVDSLVSRCALENAVVGVVRLVPGSDLPVMTANQLRLAPRRRGRVRPAARAGPGLRARGRRRRGPRVARARPGAHAARGPRGGGRFCARGSPAPARWPRAPPCACASRRPDLLARAAERPRGARLCARPSRRGRPPPERGTSRSGRSAHEGGAGEPLSSDRAAARARGAPGALPRPRVGGLRASGRPLPSVHGLRRRLRGRPAQPRRRDSLQPGERPGGHELRALLPAVDGPVGPHAGARRAAACRSRAPPRSPPSTRSASRSPTSSSPPTSWRRSTSRASRSPPRSATRTTPSSSRAVRRPGTASRSRPSLTRCCSATGEESIVEVCDSEIARAEARAARRVLRRLARVPGTYVPSLYEVLVDETSTRWGYAIPRAGEDVPRRRAQALRVRLCRHARRGPEDRALHGHRAGPPGAGGAARLRPRLPLLPGGDDVPPGAGAPGRAGRARGGGGPRRERAQRGLALLALHDRPLQCAGSSTA